MNPLIVPYTVLVPGPATQTHNTCAAPSCPLPSSSRRRPLPRRPSSPPPPGLDVRRPHLDQPPARPVRPARLASPRASPCTTKSTAVPRVPLRAAVLRPRRTTRWPSRARGRSGWMSALSAVDRPSGFLVYYLTVYYTPPNPPFSLP